MSKFLVLFICSIVVSENSVDAPVVNLKGVKCVVSGNNARINNWSDYLGGRVYFDNNTSRRKFEADPRPFLTKANHQLVVTGQFVQKKCPIRNVIVSSELKSKTTVAGVVLTTCCKLCASKIKNADTEMIEHVFGAKNFESIFMPRPNQSVGPSNAKSTRRRYR